MIEDWEGIADDYKKEYDRKVLKDISVATILKRKLLVNEGLWYSSQYKHEGANDEHLSTLLKRW